MVDVDRVDARGPQGVALQVQRLGAIRLRDAGVADQHVSQTVVWDMRRGRLPGERAGRRVSSETGSAQEAPRAQSNEDLVRRFVEACRRTRTILPATTTIEWLCGAGTCLT